MGTRTQQPCHDDDDDDLPGGPGPAATTISGQSVSMSGSVGSPSNRSEQTMATPASDNTFLRLNNLDIHGDEAGSQPPTAWVYFLILCCDLAQMLPCLGVWTMLSDVLIESWWLRNCEFVVLALVVRIELWVWFDLLNWMLFWDSNVKKKRGQRAVGGDKSGRGLRQFSMKGVWLHPFSLFLPSLRSIRLRQWQGIGGSWCIIDLFLFVLIVWLFYLFPLLAVCEKVESKGRTTYNEVGYFLASLICKRM